MIDYSAIRIEALPAHEFILHAPCCKCGCALKSKPVTLHECEAVAQELKDGIGRELFECAGCSRGNNNEQIIAFLGWANSIKSGETANNSFHYWDGNDLYAVRVAIDENRTYGFIVYNEAGEKISNDSVLDNFVRFIAYENRIDKDSFTVLV